jgi:hypothetical protein
MFAGHAQLIEPVIKQKAPQQGCGDFKVGATTTLDCDFPDAGDGNDQFVGIVLDQRMNSFGSRSEPSAARSRRCVSSRNLIGL